MDKTNIQLYQEKYKHVPKDRIERIRSYLETVGFSHKDEKRFDEEVKRIKAIEFEAIKIVFYILPEVTPRPRANLFTGAFYVKNAASNNKFMKLVVENENRLKGLIATPCYFYCRSYFPIPKHFSKVDTLLAEMGFIRPPIQKDWDNLGKTYSDMIQRWLLVNDALILSGTSEKFWSLKPRVEIEIDYMVDYDCNHNRRNILRSKTYQRAMGLIDKNKK